MRSPRYLSAAGIAASLLVLSATVVVAQDGTTHTVAQDGSGDHDTISAAIEAAAPGDSVLIAPGEYVENLYIDKPVTLSGDGPREDIVLFHDDSKRQILDMDPVGMTVITIYVDNADVTIEHLSIMDEDDGYVSIVLMGGESTIRDIFANDFVGVRGDASAVIEDSYIERLGTWGPNHTIATGLTVRDLLWASEGSSGRFEGNTVHDFPIVIDSGANFEVIGNTIRPLDDEPGIVLVDPATTATVSGNSVEGGWTGVLVEFAGETLIEGNTFSGGELGVVAVESPSTIRGNTISNISETGIGLIGDGMIVEGNIVTGGRIGVHVENPDDFPTDVPAIEEPPRIVDNTITEATHFGLVIEDSAPDVSGNTICAGRQAIRVTGNSDPQLGTNEICEPEGEAGG